MEQTTEKTTIDQTIPLNSTSKLVCGQCKKPLSMFPIYRHTELSHLICGRCVNAANPNDLNLAEYVRNWAYEELASYHKFNCCYQQEGCIKLLFPRQVENHEKYCYYRMYDCLLGKDVCSWQGLYDQYFMHFKKNHDIFILNTDLLEIDFNSSRKEICLLSFGEELFAVSKDIDSKKKTLKCALRPLRDEKKYDNLSYMVEFKNSNLKCSLRKLQGINETYEVRKVVLEKAFRNLDDIFLHIEIINKDIDVGYTGISYEYECPVCFQHLVPLIYLCVKGHSICDICKEKVNQCPLCKARFEGGRNYSLEKAIGMKMVSCRNVPCTFRGKGSSIQQHEKECMHRMCKCPFNDHTTVPCNKSMQLGEIYDHVVAEHSDSVLEFKNEEYIKLTFKEMYVLKYMSRLFRLVTWKVTDYNGFGNNFESFLWCLQLIGNNDHFKKFKFSVDIDNSNTGQRTIMHGRCVQMINRHACFEDRKNYLSIHSTDVDALTVSEYCVRILEI